MFFFKVYLNNFSLLYVFVIIIFFIINECFNVIIVVIFVIILKYIKNNVLIFKLSYCNLIFFKDMVDVNVYKIMCI